MNRSIVAVSRGVFLGIVLLQAAWGWGDVIAQEQQKAGSADTYRDQLTRARGKLADAQRLLDASELDNALNAGKEAYAVYEALPNTLPEAIYGRANTLSLIGMIFAAAGEDGRAVDFFRNSQSLYERLNGAEGNSRVTLEHMAVSMRKLHRDREAVNTYLQAGEIADKAKDSEHSLNDKLNALSIMDAIPPDDQLLRTRMKVAYAAAGTRVELSRFDEAAAGFRDVLKVIDRFSGGDIDTLHGGALEGLAVCTAKQGQTDEAITQFRQVIDFYSKGASRTVELARSYYNLAELLRTKKAFSEASDNYRRSASLYQKTEGLTAKAADSLFKSGGVSHDAQLYTSALEDFANAAKLYEMAGLNKDRAACHRHMAAVLADSGNWSGAQEQVTKELDILKNLPDSDEDQATAHKNMGVVFGHLSRFDAAYEEYRQALSQYSHLPGTDVEQAEVRYRAGSALVQMKQNAQALQVLSGALSLYRKLTDKAGYSAYDHALCAYEMANALNESGRGAESIDLYREAIGLLERSNSGAELLADLHWLLGMQLAQKGDISGSLVELGGGFGQEWRVQSSQFFAVDRSEKDELVRTAASKARDIYRVAVLKPEIGAPVALDAALATKSLASQISKFEAITLLRAPADQVRHRSELRSLVARLVLMRVSEFVKEADENGDQLTRSAEELEKLEGSILSSNAGRASLPIANADGLRSALRRGDVVLEYVTFSPNPAVGSEKKDNDEQEHYAVLVIKSGTTVGIKDLGLTADIDAAILRYRNLYNSQIDPRNKRQLDEDALGMEGAKIRRLVLDPALQLAGSAQLSTWKPRRIYVAPTGTISLIPFEVFPAERKEGEGWRYLVEDYEVVYLAAARDLIAGLPTPAKAPNDLWIIADPNYDGALGNGAAQSGTPPAKVYQDAVPNNWNRLGTAEFATVLERRTRELGLQPHLLKDDAAAESAALGLHSPGVLVFATHGHFMADVAPVAKLTWHSVGGKSDFGADYKVSLDPLMRSMLVLAGANQRYQPISANANLGRNASKISTVPVASTQRPPFDDGLLTGFEAESLDLHGTQLVVLLGCESGAGVPQRRAWKAGTMVMSSEIGAQVENGSLGNLAFAQPEITDEALTGLRRAFYIAGAHSIISSFWTVPLQESTQLIEDFSEIWLGSNHGLNRYAAFHAAQVNALQRARAKGSGHPLWWAEFSYLGEPADAPERH